MRGKDTMRLVSGFDDGCGVETLNKGLTQCADHAQWFRKFIHGLLLGCGSTYKGRDLFKFGGNKDFKAKKGPKKDSKRESKKEIKKKTEKPKPSPPQPKSPSPQPQKESKVCTRIK
eukprot:1218594-Amorphochlora_amoeboformis.AAC.1